MVHPKVAPRYAEKYQNCSIKQDFAEVTWNNFKVDGADMRVIPSSEKQAAFVRVVAGRGGEVDVEAADAEEDCNFEGMKSADKLAPSQVHGKLR